MIRSVHVHFLAGVVAALLSTGCANRPAFPVYPPMPPDEALKILAARAHAVQTVSSQALVTLTRHKDETVRLDAALVMKPPDHARLRAYKFGQAVFDITLTPRGVWLLQTQDSHREESLAAGSNSGHLIVQWLHLMTRFFDEPGLRVREVGSELLVQSQQDSGARIVCQVDRRTLFVRRFSLEERTGNVKFSLAFDRYRMVSAIAWPERIQASSAQGHVLIELHDVELNGPLLPTAFRPPVRAEKLP